ncbi:MAG: carbohydrate-binding family 9-like protein [Victivallaceae bacterium]|jgi:hypothetical protein
MSEHEQQVDRFEKMSILWRTSIFLKLNFCGDITEYRDDLLAKIRKEFRISILMLMHYVLMMFFFFCHSRLAAAEMSPAPSDEDYRWYKCCRAAGKITIDGKADEAAWKVVPWTRVFGDAFTGQAPRFSSKTKVLWDDDFLYIAFDFDDPNVWNESHPRYTFMFHYNCEGFLKIYLDPDMDGRNFVEMHLNAANSFRDMFFKHTHIEHPSLTHVLNYQNQWEQEKEPYARLDWNCQDIRTAVLVRGTINNPADIDEGWSAEIAIPWKGLSQLTNLTTGSHNNPPRIGDDWGVQLGRRYFRQKWAKPEIESTHRSTEGGNLEKPQLDSDLGRRV